MSENTNPIPPIQHFVPDAAARQWSDGRMYLYGSYDIIRYPDVRYRRLVERKNPEIEWR